MPVAFRDSLDRLLVKAGRYMDYDGLELIRKAYEFTVESNRRFDSLRFSGEPAMVHPLSVAERLIEWGLDKETVAAGILHDTIEDPNIHKLQLRATFGDTVMRMVEGVSKLKEYEIPSAETPDEAYYMRIFLAIAKDMRVALIKMADRLHNMGTLESLPVYRQLKNCRETDKIFIPMANRLGMEEIMKEMNETSFRFSSPEKYEEVDSFLKTRVEEENIIFNKIFDSLKPVLDETGIEYHIGTEGYDILHSSAIISDSKPENMMKTGFLEITTTSPGDCYLTLGAIHSVFRPYSTDPDHRELAHRFIDTIHHPDNDLKRMLETLVVGPLGMPVLVRILTREMKRVNSMGIVARLCAGSRLERTDFLEKRMKEVQDTISFYSDQIETEDTTALVETLIRSLREKKTFVFAPDGSTLVLPETATVLDFAYKMGPDIGNHYLKSIVDRREVNMDYVPKRLEHLTVATDPDARPRVEWLDCVSTGFAHNEIQKYLNSLSREEAIEEGRRALLLRAGEAGLCPSNRIEDLEKTLKLTAEDFDIHQIDDVYVHVVNGEFGLKTVLEVLRKQYMKIVELEDWELVPRITGHAAYKIELEPKIIETEKPLKSPLQPDEFCSPLPGDEVFVFAGMKKSFLHRKDCHFRKSRPLFRGRRTAAVWKETSGRLFPARIKIKFFPAKNIHQRIFDQLEKSEARMLRPIDINPSSRHLELMELIIMVRDSEHAEKVCDDLLAIKEVAVAERI